VYWGTALATAVLAAFARVALKVDVMGATMTAPGALAATIAVFAVRAVVVRAFFTTTAGHARAVIVLAHVAVGADVNVVVAGRGTRAAPVFARRALAARSAMLAVFALHVVFRVPLTVAGFTVKACATILALGTIVTILFYFGETVGARNTFAVVRLFVAH
jgi:hypothetical protein